MKTATTESPIRRNYKFLRVENLAAMTRSRKQQLCLRSVTRMEQTRPLIQKIMMEICRDGDAALLRYTKKFDGVDLDSSSIRVSKEEIRAAYARVKPDLIVKMKMTLGLVKSYHTGEKEQLQTGFDSWEKGIRHDDFPGSANIDVGQLRTPIDRIGLYVPGGRAPLFTTALMGITPARIARVPQIIVASPPSHNGDIDPKIIVAADLAGATLIVRAGGAQAIAAMAFGTKSVPKVDKIIGPGNIYVTAAKSYAASNGICAIDFLAGPSEILIVADDSADPEWAARDMISQAEHDYDACAILVTDSKEVASAVRTEIQKILDSEDREFGVDSQEGRSMRIAEISLSKFGAILVAENLTEAFSFANEFAPEHLEIMTNDPRRWLKKARNAGAVFLGHYSPVAIGDYVCPNHILPTGGAARFSSGINLDVFMKKPATSNVPGALRSALNNLVETLSKAEGLYNQHGLSVKARLRPRRSVRRRSSASH